MFKKFYQLLAIFAGLLLLVGCEKGSSDESQEGLLGKWVPVYACGQENGITYNTLFDGEVDKNGEIQITYVGVSKPDVKQESTMIIPGIRFFKKGGKNVYIRFYKKSPQEEIGKPLLYKFENGILSLELPMGVFVSNCSPDVFYSGSGKFQEMPIEFMDNGQIKFNNVTYSKKK